MEKINFTDTQLEKFQSQIANKIAEMINWTMDEYEGSWWNAMEDDQKRHFTEAIKRLSEAWSSIEHARWKLPF